jgi:hypothetical protein
MGIARLQHLESRCGRRSGSPSPPVPSDQETRKCNRCYILESRPNNSAYIRYCCNCCIRATPELQTTNERTYVAPGRPVPPGDAPPQCGHADDRRDRLAGVADRPHRKAVTALTARLVATSRANFSTKAVMAHLHQADGWVSGLGTFIPRTSARCRPPAATGRSTQAAPPGSSGRVASPSANQRHSRPPVADATQRQVSTGRPVVAAALVRGTRLSLACAGAPSIGSGRSPGCGCRATRIEVSFVEVSFAT